MFKTQNEKLFGLCYPKQETLSTKQVKTLQTEKKQPLTISVNQKHGFEEKNIEK